MSISHPLPGRLPLSFFKRFFQQPKNPVRLNQIHAIGPLILILKSQIQISASFAVGFNGNRSVTQRPPPPPGNRPVQGQDQRSYRSRQMHNPRVDAHHRGSLLEHTRCLSKGNSPGQIDN